MSELSHGDEARRALDKLRVKLIAGVIRQHIKCDATGLSPAVASVYLTGFDDAAQAVLAALRADPVRAVEQMRTKVEDTLTEWTRPSAIRLMVGEMMTAQEGRTANAVAAMLAAKIRAALSIQPAAEGGADE